MVPISDKTLWVKLFDGRSDVEITDIHVTGSTPGSNARPPASPGSTMSDEDHPVRFHWRFYLHLRGFSKESVILDMTPGGLDPHIGVLMVNSKSIYKTTASTFLVREVAVSSSNPITVRALVNMLVSSGLTRYKFDDQGQGCRWWCEVVMQKLEDSGYVEEGTVAGLDQWWKDVAASDSRVPATQIRGSFY